MIKQYKIEKKTVELKSIEKKENIKITKLSNIQCKSKIISLNCNDKRFNR